MSNFLREQLKQQEGWVPHAYQDSKGYWTIGFGHLIDKSKHGGITQRIGLLILDDDIYAARTQVDRAFPWAQALAQARYDAIINMCFHMGVSGLGTFVRFLSAAQAGDFEKASAEMLNSRWAMNHPTRAMTLANQMRTGRYPE